MKLIRNNLIGPALFGATLLLGSQLHAVTITGGFGSIPNAPANPYSGSGIPSNNSVWTQASDLPGGDLLTLSLTATQYKSAPAPLNNGVDTFFVQTGTLPLGSGGSQRSPWNWNFYAASSEGLLSDYTFSITIENVLNGETHSFDPLSIPDNGGVTGTWFGNSESLDFSVFGTPILYNPALDNQYNITLTAKQGGTDFASTSIKVVAGSGAPASVPDGGSTFGLLLAGVALLPLLKKK